MAAGSPEINLSEGERLALIRVMMERYRPPL